MIINWGKTPADEKNAKSFLSTQHETFRSRRKQTIQLSQFTRG